MTEQAIQDREPLEKRSISLTRSQWTWLERRSLATGTYSQSAELRALILAEMERERQATDESGRLAA